MLESYRDTYEKKYFFLLLLPFCSITRHFEKEGITMHLRMHRNAAMQSGAYRQPGGGCISVLLGA